MYSENRPWGSFHVLDEGKGFKVKRIVVTEGGRLSLQSHKHRGEHWTVVSGTATVTVDDKVLTLTRAQSVDIPQGAKHRLENHHQDIVEIIEVQFGDYLGEDDIVRYDDAYNRAPDRIGIDLGGTKIDAVVLGDDGRVLFEKRVPTPKTYEAILAAIESLVREAEKHARPAATVGIGAPGSVSPKTGLWRNANILECNGKPIPQDIERRLGRPVRLENDANCFALSEAYDGAGAGHPVVACFTIGTALGGGLVIDGKLRHGPNNEAAEFGHTPMPWPNESEWPLIPCFCGKAGCVEQYVSGTGLARDYAKVVGKALKGPEIVAMARAGDDEAKAAIDRLADRLARLTAAIVNVIDPDIFVIGGGLSGLPELVEELGPRAGRYAFSGAATIKVARAKHGEKSGVRGAARLWS